jgi:hypothetical protein
LSSWLLNIVAAALGRRSPSVSSRKPAPLAAAINAVPGAAERSSPQHVTFDHFNGWKGSELQRRWPDF